LEDAPNASNVDEPVSGDDLGAYTTTTTLECTDSAGGQYATGYRQRTRSS
jgi:hypothetical protein